MQIPFTFSVILNGAVIVLGLFAAFILFMKKKNATANQLMALFLLAISLWLCDSFMRIADIYGQEPNYYFRPIYYSFAFGPLIYFYTKSIVNSQFRLSRKHLIHFIPVVIQAGLYIFLTCADYTYKRWYWQEVHLPYTYRIEFDGTFISLAIYLFFSIKIIREYQSWIKDEYSDISKNSLNWLKIILTLMLILTGQWFIEAVLRDVFEVYYSYNYTPLILGVLTLLLAYRAFLQEDQKEVIFESKSELSKIEYHEEVLNQIEARMKIHKDYLDPKLSLKEFSARCKLPQKTVSQYLNQKVDKTFHGYVNFYRVEEFKEMISDKKEKNMTLEGMAYDAGFNSKATFNRIFKKMTGMTPSEYVSKHS